MKNTFCKITVYMLLCICGAVNAYAQNTYDVQGVVKNQEGKYVTDVNISIIDLYNNIIQKTNTSADGTFLLHVPDSFPQIVEMRHVAYNTYTLYLSRAMRSLKSFAEASLPCSSSMDRRMVRSKAWAR